MKKEVPQTVGLTGGIGSGKTTASMFFERYGYPVYNADVESKLITATSSQVREALTKKFGTKLYKDNKLDKQLLASIIFGEGNEENLAFVNSLIHPLVWKDFQSWINGRRDTKLVVIESAILFESGFDKLVDYVINVSAPESMRIQRVMNRDGLSREQVLARMRNQLSDEERERRSHYTIVNDGCVALGPQIGKVCKIITSM